MREREPKLTRTIIRWAEHFTHQAVQATDRFYVDYNIDESLNLSPEQGKVFLAYFAHYWVLKNNIESARLARNPLYEQMSKVLVLNIISRSVYNIDDGVNLAGETLLGLARKYAARVQDNSHSDIRNAANMLSSIYLDGVAESAELNQKIDRALSRIKIGNSASSASQMV